MSTAVLFHRYHALDDNVSCFLRQSMLGSAEAETLCRVRGDLLWGVRCGDSRKRPLLISSTLSHMIR